MLSLKKLVNLFQQGEAGKIYFIRHAESEDNLILQKEYTKYKTQEINEPLITLKGQLQTQSLAKFFKSQDIKPTKIIMSPQVRSCQTGEILYDNFISECKNIQTLIEPDACEISKTYHKGEILPGKNREFFEKNFPKFTLSDKIKENGWNFDEQAENMKKAVQRGQQFLDNIAKDIVNEWEQSKQKQVYFIVSHSFYIDALVGIIFQRPKENNVIIPVPNTGVSSFVVTQEGNYGVIEINQFYHLSNGFVRLQNDREFENQVQKVDGLIPLFNKSPKL